jgi:hypothetical protein
MPNMDWIEGAKVKSDVFMHTEWANCTYAWGATLMEQPLSDLRNTLPGL